MPTPLLPPRGVFAATTLLFDQDLSPGIKETLLQLISLAWANPGHETPPLSYAQLCQLTGKGSSTLHGHIAALRDHRSALRLRSAGHGTFIVSIAAWLYPGRADSPEQPAPAASENLESPVKVKRINQEEEEGSPHPPDSYHPIDSSQKPAGLKNGGELEPAVDAALRKAGVYSFLLPEVARAGWPSADLLALLAWCQADRPERPGGLFMARLRGKAEIPARFFGQRCEACGQAGGHAPDCRRRYLDYLR
jgi:hypothetical protein